MNSAAVARLSLIFYFLPFSRRLIKRCTRRICFSLCSSSCCSSIWRASSMTFGNTFSSSGTSKARKRCRLASSHIFSRLAPNQVGWVVKVSSGRAITTNTELETSRLEIPPQIAFKYSKTCHDSIPTSTACGLAQNICSSPTIRASHRSFWPFRNVSRRISLWSCLASPMA